MPLIISSDTEETLPKSILRREIDEIEVKGKINKVRIFEVFHWEQKKYRDKKIELSPIFKKALVFYRKNDLKNCYKQLKEYEKTLKDDPILNLYFDRCKN